MLLPSLTPRRARLLTGLKIGELTEPCHISINWLSCHLAHERPAFITKNIHHHTFFEVHFILSGKSGYLIGDGTKYALCEGECLLSTPGVHHTVLSADCARLSLTFLPDAESELYGELSAKPSVRFALSDMMLSRFEDILREAEYGGLLSHAIIRTRIFDLICDICRSIGINEHCGMSVDINAGSEAAIKRACTYILDNRDRMLTCREVSRQCHFNEKYLGRLFKLHTGMTLLAYIHKQKIKYAEELLRDKTLSLKAVSEQLGFANEYYFNTFFKRINGITPGQYRKLI
ncbi:MAG: helix-turn-helix transcriptional regulator [Clostridia bacterium]|nr:helix-turn-helix transcriptional regulator [Clostridia bacterium]